MPNEKKRGLVIGQMGSSRGGFRECIFVCVVVFGLCCLWEPDSERCLENIHRLSFTVKSVKGFLNFGVSNKCTNVVPVSSKCTNLYSCNSYKLAVAALCYGKPIFVFTSQTSTDMLERLFLVSQNQGNANLSTVGKILCLCLVECQSRLMVSSGLKMCDFTVCINLATFFQKPDLTPERSLLV